MLIPQTARLFPDMPLGLGFIGGHVGATALGGDFPDLRTGTLPITVVELGMPERRGLMTVTAQALANNPRFIICSVADLYTYVSYTTENGTVKSKNTRGTW